MEKLSRGKKIDIFEDIVPEFKDLKGKSYAGLVAGGSIKICENFPKTNLGFLLKSGLYDTVIFPMDCYPDKNSFKVAYGLSENRGCRLSFNHILNLIKNGKLRLTLTTAPIHYKADFYQDIFNRCEELPSYTGYRVTSIFHRMRLAQIAMSEKVHAHEVLMLHPEYSLTKTLEEVEQTFGNYLETWARKSGFKKDVVISKFSTRLWDLRILGLERLAAISLRCAQLDKALGHAVMTGFFHYLAGPIMRELCAINNYSDLDIASMSFLKILPRKLEIVWKDLLSSAPVSSSVASHQICLETVELKGLELLKFIEDFSDNKTTRALRQEVTNVNTALGTFDVYEAERSFKKVDEIITENINSEIKGYARKGRVSSHLLRLGKTFTAMASEGLLVLSGLMAATGKFEWAMTALASAGLPVWLRERLNQITPEDIVRWWSKTWSFEDHGIGFVLWEKSRGGQEVHAAGGQG